MKTNKQDRFPHDREWQLQTAKNCLSQVVEQARNDGPQTITLRGKPAAVVVSFEDYKNMTRPQTTLSRFFGESPLNGTELDLSRSNDLAREVVL